MSDITVGQSTRRDAHVDADAAGVAVWNPAIRILRNESTRTGKKKKKNCLSVSIHLSRFCWLEPWIERRDSSNDFRINVFFSFLVGYLIPFFFLFFLYDLRIIILILFFFLLRDRISVMAINRLVTGNFLKKECFRSNYGKKRLNGLIVLLWRSN